jgi:hypothetical protein
MRATVMEPATLNEREALKVMVKPQRIKRNGNQKERFTTISERAGRKLHRQRAH